MPYVTQLIIKGSLRMRDEQGPQDVKEGDKKINIFLIV